MVSGMGFRIKGLRKRSGLSQASFGKKVGLTGDHVAKIERGHRRPSEEAIIKMKSFFNVSIDYLYTGESKGLAENQSQVGMNQCVKTKLAKQMDDATDLIKIGLRKFDEIAFEYSDLELLEGTAAALSINPETMKALNEVRQSI